MAKSDRPEVTARTELKHLGIAGAIERLADAVSDSERLLGVVRGVDDDDTKEAVKRAEPNKCLSIFLEETEANVDCLIERLDVVNKGMKEGLF